MDENPNKETVCTKSQRHGSAQYVLTKSLGKIEFKQGLSCGKP
jgi:hypothetical protein